MDDLLKNKIKKELEKTFSKAKTNEEKHIILFNLPEVLKAWKYQEEIF